MQREIVLQVNRITKKYIREGFLGTRLSSVDALKGIDFKLEEGEILGIVGESGSGKSTLAKIICGLEMQSSGILEWNEKYIKRLEGVPAQMVFQNPFDSLNPKLYIGYMLKEAISYGSKKKISLIDNKEVMELLKEVGMDKVELEKYPHQFSGGQRQRLGIARALAMQPALLVCDEAVSALDISIQAQIILLLKKINSNKKLPIIFIAHDIEAVSMIAKNVIVMKDGEIVEQGPVEAIISDPMQKYTKALIDAVPRNPYL